MQRPEKAKKIEELTEVFNEARSVVLNDFTGLNVEKISENNFGYSLGQDVK